MIKVRMQLAFDLLLLELPHNIVCLGKKHKLVVFF